MSPWNEACVQGREEIIQHELLSSYCISVPVTLSRIPKLVSTLSVSLEGARFKMSSSPLGYLHCSGDNLSIDPSPGPEPPIFYETSSLGKRVLYINQPQWSFACFINVPSDKAIPVADEEGRNRSERKR